MISSIPTIAISYESPKAFGIMKMIGLERYCIEISKMESNDVMERFSEIEKLAHKVRSKIGLFLIGLDKSFEDYKNLIKKYGN